MSTLSCNVCGGPLGPCLYESEGGRSLTSLCQVRPGTTRVHACPSCGHLQTEEMPDAAAFYESDYGILVDSEEEDQIYELAADGSPVYRTAHQVKVVLDKVALPAGALLLDCGCAKSSTIKALVAQRPDVVPHLFDVSARYIPFWEKFVKPEHWAVHEMPAHWQGRFDVVTSFFSMEHMVRPADSLRHMAAVLKPGGVFYGIVPNVATNVADFIVLDHVNHFSETSLRHLLQAVGLEVEAIDAQAHRGAFVVVARRVAGAVAPLPEPFPERFADSVKASLAHFDDMATFWRSVGERVRAQEASIDPAEPIAIYGAGFYGAFIASCLRHPERIVCHLDQNAFLQGRQLHGRPIVPPAARPAHVATVWVGLNPVHARQVVAGVPSLVAPGVRLFHLE